jgi:hypothetical protein
MHRTWHRSIMYGIACKLIDRRSSIVTGRLPARQRQQLTGVVHPNHPSPPYHQPSIGVMALRIGVAGLGTVGGGVCQILKQNAALIAARCGGRAVELTAVSDIVQPEGLDLAGAKFYDDAVEMAAGGECDVVVETIGGYSVALTCDAARIVAPARPCLATSPSLALCPSMHPALQHRLKPPAAGSLRLRWRRPKAWSPPTRLCWRCTGRAWLPWLRRTVRRSDGRQRSVAASHASRP